MEALYIEPKICATCHALVLNPIYYSEILPSLNVTLKNIDFRSILYRLALTDCDEQCLLVIFFIICQQFGKIIQPTLAGGMTYFLCC